MRKPGSPKVAYPVLLLQFALLSGTCLPSSATDPFPMQELTRDQLIQKADEKASRQDHFKAINLYTKAIKKDPHCYRAYFRRAQSRKMLGDFKSAVLDLNHALLIDRNSVHALMARGWCLKKMGANKEALADFDRALAVKPDFVRALENRAGVKLQMGDFQGALADYNKILAIRPASGRELAKLLIPNVNKMKHKKSISIVQKTPSGKPLSIEIEPAGKGGSSKRRTGNSARSTGILTEKQLAKINNKAAAAIKSGNYDRAVSVLQPLIEMHPQYDLARRNLTIAFNNHGLKLARKSASSSARKFRAALYYTPSEKTSRRNLNAILKELGNNPRSYRDRVALGNEQLIDGHYIDAFVEYTEALRIRNTPDLRRKIAEVCLLLDGRKAEAKEVASKPPVPQAKKADGPGDLSIQAVMNSALKKIAIKPGAGTGLNLTGAAAVSPRNSNATTENKVTADATASTQPGDNAAATTKPANIKSGDQSPPGDAFAAKGTSKAEPPTPTTEIKVSNTTDDTRLKEKKVSTTASENEIRLKKVGTGASARPPLRALPLPAPGQAFSPVFNSGLDRQASLYVKKEDIRREWHGRMSLGSEQFDQGDYRGAEDSYKAAVGFAEQLGANSLELSDSLERLASVYMVHKKINQARSMMLRVVNIRRLHYNEGDPRIKNARDKARKLAELLGQPATPQ